MSGKSKPETVAGPHIDLGYDLENGIVPQWERKHPGWQTNAGEIAYTDTDLPFPNQATLDRRSKRGAGFPHHRMQDLR